MDAARTRIFTHLITFTQHHNLHAVYIAINSLITDAEIVMADAAAAAAADSTVAAVESAGTSTSSTSSSSRLGGGSGGSKTAAAAAAAASGPALPGQQSWLRNTLDDHVASIFLPRVWVDLRARHVQAAADK
jgi:hypothetical protein